MSNDNDREPFLSRWSRMKRDAAEQPTAPNGVPASGVDEGVATSNPAEPNDAPADEQLDLASLPRVEDLTAETDITAFLDARVPATLRNAALGRMWTLDPTIRDFIEVAENQWNWNVPGGAPFYELMEPGTGAAATIADASSAISRALGVPQELADTKKIVSETAIDIQRTEYAEPLEGSSAVQQPACTSASSEAVSDQQYRSSKQHVAENIDSNAASQQNSPEGENAVADPRRRHGSALPI